MQRENGEATLKQKRAAQRKAGDKRNTVILDIPQSTYRKIHSTPELARLLDGKEILMQHDQGPMDKRTGKVNLPQVYNERVQSIAKAMLYIIQAQPNSRLNPVVKRQFEDYVKQRSTEILAQFQGVKNKHHHKEFVSILEDYASELTVALVKTRLADSPKSAGHLLDLGEAYWVIEQGRAGHGVTTTIHYAQNSDEQNSESLLESGIVLQFEEPVAALSTTQARDYETLVLWLNGQIKGHHNLPWVDVMSANERYLLFSLLSNVEVNDQIIPQVKELISSIPSKLRSITGMANKSRHHLFIFNYDGKLEHYSNRIRHAYPSPRDFKQEAIRKRQTMLNIHNLIVDEIGLVVAHNAHALDMDVDTYLEKLESEGKKIPVLLQSLITPLKILQLFGNPDPTIHQDKIDIVPMILQMIESEQLPPITVNGQDISKNIAIASSNYPLNTDLAQAIKADELLEYADAMKEFVPENRYVTFDTLQKIYQVTPADKKPRIPRLLLASLECAVGTYANALVNSGCVSAKDRELLVTMLTDALVVFVEHYSNDLTAGNRLQAAKELFIAIDNKQFDNFYVREFSDFFAQFILNGSGQTIAASNAPGSFGFKTPKKYLGTCSFLESALTRHVSHSEAFKLQSNWRTKPLDIFYSESEALADKNDIGKKLVVAKKYDQIFIEKGDAIFDAIVKGIGAQDEYFHIKEAPHDYQSALKLIHQIGSHPKFLQYHKSIKYTPPKEIANILKLFATIQPEDLQNPSESPVIQELINIAQKHGRSKSSKQNEISRFMSAIGDLGTPIHSAATDSLRSLRDELYHFPQYDDQQRQMVVTIAQIISHPTYWKEKTSGHDKPKGVYEMLKHYRDHSDYSADAFLIGLDDIITNRGSSQKRDLATDNFYNHVEQKDNSMLTATLLDAHPQFDVHFSPQEYNQKMAQTGLRLSKPRSESMGIKM